MGHRDDADRDEANRNLLIQRSASLSTSSAKLVDVRSPLAQQAINTQVPVTAVAGSCTSPVCLALTWH